jgi:hypothetical protein
MPLVLQQLPYFKQFTNTFSLLFFQHRWVIQNTIFENNRTFTLCQRFP